MIHTCTYIVCSHNPKECFITYRFYLSDRIYARVTPPAGSSAPDGGIFSRGVCFVPRKPDENLAGNKKEKVQPQLRKGRTFEKNVLDKNTDAEVMLI